MKTKTTVKAGTIYLGGIKGEKQDTAHDPILNG